MNQILQNKVDLLTEQVLLLQKMITNLNKPESNQLINNLNQEEVLLLQKMLTNLNKPENNHLIANLNQELAPHKSEDEWAPYFNSRQTPKVFNNTIDHVEKYIRTAEIYDGRVFGGYVRNVVVPRLKKKTSPGYKDVDFWFKTQQNADLFVFYMGDKLSKINDNDVDFQMNTYSFERRQYLLKCKYENVIIDIIVSPTLPVNDFDVNQLTYNGSFKSYGNKSVNDLIALIDSKGMNALPDFNGKLMDYKKKRIQSLRLTKLSKTGWVINVRGFIQEKLSDGTFNYY